jgi:hypothetical protein
MISYIRQSDRYKCILMYGMYLAMTDVDLDVEKLSFVSPDRT